LLKVVRSADVGDTETEIDEVSGPVSTAPVSTAVVAEHLMDGLRPANEGRADPADCSHDFSKDAPQAASPLETLHDTVGDAFFDAWRRAFGQLEAQYTRALTERQQALETERQRVEEAYGDALSKAEARHDRERKKMEEDHRTELSALNEAYRAALEHLEQKRVEQVETLKTGLQTELRAYGTGASAVIRRIGEGRLPVRYLTRALNGLLNGVAKQS